MISIVKGTPGRWAGLARAVSALGIAVALIPAAAPGAAAELRRYTDTQRPLKQRQAEIEELGARGDAESVRTLMALGSSDAYVKVKAIESLGGIGGGDGGLAKSRKAGIDVAEYLRDKLDHPEPGVVCAAIQSLVRVEGTHALGDVEEFLDRNRERVDGFQSVVLPVAVRALAEIDDPRSVGLLQREIEEVVKPMQEFEYGSDIVRALEALHRSEGRSVLTSYASWLQTQMPSGNPMVEEYIRAKRKEALEAAERIST